MTTIMLKQTNVNFKFLLMVSELVETNTEIGLEIVVCSSGEKGKIHARND